MESIQPQIFFSADDEALVKLRQEGQIREERSIFADCLEEYLEITHPTIKPGMPQFEEAKQAFYAERSQRNADAEDACWIFFPWLQLLVHAPRQEMYRQLHTSRNRNLVTSDEQARLFTKRIGIAGMSVGSNILNTLVLTGVGGAFKIADMDVLSLPNLNRLTAPLHAVGQNKARFFAERNLEVDPFLEMQAYTNGLSLGELPRFLDEPRLDVLVEEMDNPLIKVQARRLARERRIPVVMIADNGDGVLIDVERFDLEPDLPLFNGRLDHLDLDHLEEDMPFPRKLALIAAMAGLKEATPRMQSSILDVGQTLNTWPQLGTAAVLAGVTATFIIRRIVLGESMPSGRYHVTLEESLLPNYLSPDETSAREAHRDEVMRIFKERYHLD